MEILTNYLGYNTYFSGTAKSLIDSTEIITYSEAAIEGISKISLFNIESVYREVLDSNKYNKIEKDVEDNSFMYLSDFLKFNIIIYLDNITKDPIGYTEFLSYQGNNDNNIRIILGITILEEAELVEIGIVNSLSQVYDSGRDFIGEDLIDFSSIDKINDNLDEDDKYSRYTIHLSESKRNIYLNYGVIDNAFLYKLNISKNVNINPFNIEYHNCQVNYYGDDLVISQWNDYTYSVQSLINFNKFGNPINYTSGSKNSKTLLDQSRKISTIIGKYIISSVGNDRFLYDIELDNWIEGNYLIDVNNPNGILNLIPSMMNFDTVPTLLPFLNDVNLNLSEYSKNSLIELTGKIGDWFIYRENKNGLYYNLYTNLTKTVICRDTEKAFVLNDQILIIESEDKYFTYVGESDNNIPIYYTEAALSKINNTSLVYSEVLGFFVSESRTDEEINYMYTQERVIVDTIGEYFPNTYLFNFRKNIIPRDAKLPKLLSAFKGLLFYSKENYLNYL